MFVFANLVTTVAGLLGMVINLYIFVIIVAAFLSWVNPDPYNAIVRTLRALTEPVLYRVRKHLPFICLHQKHILLWLPKRSIIKSPTIESRTIIMVLGKRIL